MHLLRWLALLPFIGMLGGIFLFNRVMPYLFGMPLVLAWIVIWVVLTAAIMAVIYTNDPANLREEDEA